MDEEVRNNLLKFSFWTAEQTGLLAWEKLIPQKLKFLWMSDPKRKVQNDIFVKKIDISTLLDVTFLRANWILSNWHRKASQIYFRGCLATILGILLILVCTTVHRETSLLT